jgi:cytochrome c oxidase subunit 3
MWLFLTSEVLLFGALFGLYTGYRLRFGREFAEAANHNNLTIGSANTVILISSSFLAAYAVHAVRVSRNRTAALSLAATVGLGLLFLFLKSLEYRQHFAQGIFPGRLYAFEALKSHGANLFFTLYFFMTGLHALHVIGGLLALFTVLVFTWRGRYTRERHTSLELTVLYWHLVDVIWIFLWPLMYLAAQGARTH